MYMYVFKSYAIVTALCNPQWMVPASRRLPNVHRNFWWVVEPTPLKNDGVSSSVGMMTFPIYVKSKKCSKPPTSISLTIINHHL